MSKLNWVAKPCGLFLLWAGAAFALPAQRVTTVARFNSADGAAPHGGLIQATDGNLYGTTDGGGANTNGNCKAYGFTGCGTVYKVAPNGAVTTLYSFCAQPNCADGYIPEGPLLQGSDGNFYGATVGGGAFNHCVVGTCGGTIFRITPGGTLTTIYSFSSGAGGYEPNAALLQTPDGNFYGTTYGGGSNSHTCMNYGGCGTIFRFTPGGTLTTLHTFDFTDGSNPFAGLIQGTDGNFYGTTIVGGAHVYGTVFKITPSGTLTTLYSFCSQSKCADGDEPLAELIQAADGNLYGTTQFGGLERGTACQSGCGTIFKISISGSLTTIHRFGFNDGEEPGGALVQGTDGNFYGTTVFGGLGVGTAFQITPSGELTTLYNFDHLVTHGIEPAGALVQDTNGNFYGTTSSGGPANGMCQQGCGTVFGVSVGLGPFVEPQTTSGQVGAAVNILGTDLTGATSVTFNGTTAAFTVVSSSLITTTVPSGATTGPVQVVTPGGGTLSSNVPFRVLP